MFYIKYIYTIIPYIYLFQMLYNRLFPIKFYFKIQIPKPEARRVHGRSSTSFGSSQADIRGYSAACSSGLEAGNFTNKCYCLTTNIFLIYFDLFYFQKYNFSAR